MFNEIFSINSDNIAYLNERYQEWEKSPHNNIDPQLADFFRKIKEEPILQTLLTSPQSTQKSLSYPQNTSENSYKTEHFKNLFRLYGHLRAKLDPLSLKKPHHLPELSPASLLNEGMEPALLHEMEEIYCHKIGAEFMHLQNLEQRQWWCHTLENQQTIPLPLSQEHILNLLTQAEGFEFFCQQNFPGIRRFGLEGSESLLVGLQTLLYEASRHHMRSITLAMSHRGRLNIMGNLLQKPFEAIFSEFAGHAFQPDVFSMSGDVKYHLGTTTTLKQGSQKLTLTLLPNPSHLEAINPIALGRVRAQQEQDEGVAQHMGILIHGDAAFAGQGVVCETLQLSQLDGYKTGGTIHFIINNQIGFTTDAEAAHSGLYNTDIAKSIGAPILHVNGDDPEAVARCAALAFTWRNAFKQDIIIDIQAYRRNGHNETDEAFFTQPLMYQIIAKHPSVRQIYGQNLIEQKRLTAQKYQDLWNIFQTTLQNSLTASKNYHPTSPYWLDYTSQDSTLLEDETERLQPMTGVPIARLEEIGEAMTTLPQNFSLHPRIERQLKTRFDAIVGHKELDWATAEALALGALSLDGHRIRLSGQDCGRGTFSQRHAVLTDQKTGERYTPLSKIVKKQAPLSIYNSPLSEYAVMGFEYGYSLGNPEALTLWEAQFGDFANGAQIIIDQFLAAGETKWLQSSNLTLLLPHGYEGAGPEHSSARIERFLQLCAENNLRICTPSTPASYFHLLRRQIIRRCRKPLIVFTPKSLLRHRDAVSPLTDMGPHTRFEPVISDPHLTEKTKRIILCSGKIYYDLNTQREQNIQAGILQKETIALIRLEQLYPFPHHALVKLFQDHLHIKSLIWCQEEPRNGGAWHFAHQRIRHSLTIAKHPLTHIDYIGRKASASPATGIAQIHQKEQNEIIHHALTLS